MVPRGTFVIHEGEPYYRIAAYDCLDPFLISLASDTDLWMFVASGGGLTAGRVDADGSLFPYLTDDRLHDAHHDTGPVTIVRVEKAPDSQLLWRPFREQASPRGVRERNLYKNTVGNRLVFEEIDHELGLVFRYRWAACEEFGWVRTASLENSGSSTVRIALLDGLLNILPFGAPLALYQQASNLVDAYKKNELDRATQLGIFSLTAGITDRTEAIEILRANIVWCSGLAGRRVHLTAKAIEAFQAGRVLPAGEVLNGHRGNYLVSSDLELEPHATVRWHLAADVGRDHVQIAAMRSRLLASEDLSGEIEASLDCATDNLKRNVASADGLQLTGQPEAWSHHLANVLFNNMRGGVFLRNYDVPTDDFRDFLQERNRAVGARYIHLLTRLPETLSSRDLLALIRDTGDADLLRIGYEYLPLHFGRRHGDPSRPWNRFAIRVRDRNGKRVLHYEGNWRDIFQNWEALAVAFPDFLPSMVAKFVNASTVDGFNPYRLSRSGVDWEVPVPGDPWSNIGYWGDHQIIYLLKLLEAMHGHDPAAILRMLKTAIFSYAEVPYRIRSHAEIRHAPRSTIVFDTALAARIEKRVANIGTDGKLLLGADGRILHVNLLEKLLVPALAKLSCFIPDAGIWMNTQRPEWNDANNVLGGGGVSMVTLCYLRRYLFFLAEIAEKEAGKELPLSADVADWFDRIDAVLTGEQNLLAGGKPLAAEDRGRLLDSLGNAFSAYRQSVYASGLAGQKQIPLGRVAGLCRTSLVWIDRSIANNRRDDGLYHAYNLLKPTGGGSGVEVNHLQEMLEGQVAALSSGAIGPDVGLDVLEALYESALYRPDQRSFMLYPAVDRPGFLARNSVPEERVRAIPLLRDLLAAGEPSVLSRDATGICRFQADIHNGRDLAHALDELARQADWAEAVSRHRGAVCDLFESVFHHHSYTGRSVAMYGYEGIGCIYWHMVAKLLLAVQETVLRAEREQRPRELRDRLISMYFRIRSGLGYQKSVNQYGAFPADPYSHTPLAGGAKQPGMTGQVKEEILTRFGELGVRVEDGNLHFRPLLLQGGEFLDAPAAFQYFDVEGRAQTVQLTAGSLAFTYCQVPVVYERVTGEPWLEVFTEQGMRSRLLGTVLPQALAAPVFARSGRIKRITVGIPAATLR